MSVTTLTRNCVTRRDAYAYRRYASVRESVTRRVRIYLSHPVPYCLPSIRRMRLVAVRHMRPRPATTPSGPPQGARMGVTAGAPPGLWDPPDPGPPAGGPRGARGPGGVHFRGYLITLPVGTDVALFRYRSGIPPKNFRKFSPPPARGPPGAGAPRGPPRDPPGTPPGGAQKRPFFDPPPGGSEVPPFSTPRTGGSEGI